MQDAIEAVEEAYRAYSSQRVEIAPIVHLDVKQFNGEIDIKSGFVKGIDLIGTKIASGYYDNHKLGLPPGIAVIILMDLKTSMPIALMDGTYITAYRTGAAGAVAAEKLARKDSKYIGVIGAGTQARMQILALREKFNIERIRVWDKFDEAAEKYAQEMSGRLGIEVDAMRNPKEVVIGADILVTVTPSREVIVKSEWIEEGIHINAIGADGPGKQELDPMIIKRADKVVVDSVKQCVRIGEIQHAIREGMIREDDIYSEIGNILLGNKTGRERADEVTLFDATGIAVQDIIAAHKVYIRAQEKRIGKEVNLLDLESV